MFTTALYDQLIIVSLVLAGFLLIAKLIDLLIPALLRWVVARTTTTVDDVVIGYLRKPLFITVILGGLLWTQPSFSFSSEQLELFVKTIQSLLVLVWSWTLASVFVVISTSTLTARQNASHASDLLPFVRSMVRLALLGLAIFYLFELWGVDVTPVIASAGVAGLAVALAAKDSLANFFGGLSLFFDEAYKVGDYVIVDDRDRGEVVEIGMRSTKIRTRDDVTLSIPNSLMATSKVVNETGDSSRLRLRIRVGVSYGTDPQHVERVLLDVAHQDEHVLDDPPPVVRFRLFGESSLQYDLLVWVADPHLKGHITHDINTAIFYAFHREHIVIPYPQMDVHVQKGVAIEKRD